MKTFSPLILFSLLLFLPLTAFAEKGVGIMWTTQNEIVKEGQLNCINYSVYNPFDEDTNIYLSASGTLESFVVDSQPVPVPAGTTHDKAIPISLCFNIPKVYKEDCVAGIVCSRSCEEPQVVYAGEVLAMEKTILPIGGPPAGSTTKAMASVPLTLSVACEPIAKNWAPVIAITIIIVILLCLVMARKPKSEAKTKG
ncbi:MAG: hypothetical protein QW063_00750 [Candidatus Nanoarchaeia archaeon]